MTAPLVLVVDDQDALRFAKVQTLRRAGLRVVDASTGRDGLELVDSVAPDIVLLDVNLPDISGLEVCRRLRSRHQGLPSLQILQISNTAIGPADQIRGLELGADAYLTEPVDPGVLVATVQSMLRVRAAEAKLAAALDREREARAAAEEANRLKDEFVATLSHELRTPLNAVMGWVWQLRHASLSEAARGRALDSLERNVTIQAQLINDLLDLSRSARGKLRLEMHVLDVRSAAAAAVESVGQVAAHKGVTVQVSGEPVAVIADAARLQQILGNLLGNALQFTPAGGRITVSVASDAAHAILTVSDTGSGIDPAFLPHVFDQFRQGESGLSRKHGGLGLGLAVVRQLAELHGGGVTVASGGAGQGTTFTVRLPREDVVKERADGRPVLAGIRVVLVGDDASDAESLSATFESSGAVVTAASSPGAAAILRDEEVVGLIVCAEDLEATARERILREVRGVNVSIPALAIGASLSAAAASGDPQTRIDAIVPQPYVPADIVRAAAHVLGERLDPGARHHFTSM